jgi:hypothetical protein
MPILLAGTIEIVHIEQIPALFTFRLGQVLLYIYIYIYMYTTGNQTNIGPFFSEYVLANFMRSLLPV